MFTQAKLIITAVVLAALIGLGTWWHLSRVHAAEKAVHAHYAVVLSEIREKTAAAVTAFRATETAWRSAIDKEAANGQARIDLARHDAAGARTERDRLLADVARYRTAARTAQHSSAPTAGPTTGDALDLFADLFSRADARAGELAEFADAAHAAGLTCERSFDALSRTKPATVQAPQSNQ
ncbi:DUF2514 family protein [Diaphorobacter sp. HDW4B]|uniref:DUF2514 family protein n=1 Tax=Diaphorobacter sp. HDW4B TaxID=2714925 RepID=UPI00140C3012|nr:DUF2514 family protein [Diaphorobacter sp. HDW4B]QIL69525.1 DUF2514 family protein [Diaphorobacter sp. HDW4B]